MKTRQFVSILFYTLLGLVWALGAHPPLPVAAQGPSTEGWRGEYYANPDLVGAPTLIRSDLGPGGSPGIDFDWGTGSPAPGIPADRFSVRWTRSLSFEEGVYRFRVSVDDGMRLFVDGVLLIDEWRDGPRRQVTADRRLSAGQHVLRVEYYENGGQAVAQVGWERISSAPTGDVRWRGEYWSNVSLNGTPTLVRADAGASGTMGIDFDWGSGAPAPSLPADNFSARWTRSLSFEEGQYRFRAVVDDGVRVYVDGVLVINEWRDGGRREVTADRRLSAGLHTLRVEYYERQGLALVQVGWDRLATTVPDDAAWRGEYWANLGLSGSPALVRSDPTLAFDWGLGAPGSGLPADNFGARWTRRLNLDAGTYRFHILVDDGIRLWVDDVLIVDAWTDHDSADWTVDYTIAQGSHTIRVEYYERIGRARVWVWWERLVDPANPDWSAEYWNNRTLSGTPVLARNDRAIDFNWGSGSPSPILPSDNFSARWTRERQFDAGTYRFRVLADDGVRVWVDGRLIIDAWRDQMVTEYTADLALTAGRHTLRVEYYEHGGGAHIQVRSEKLTPGSPSAWRGEYWTNRTQSGTPVLVRTDAEVQFDWGDGSPASSIPRDNFSARWSRQETFSSGRYRFYAWADDGIRVRIDGTAIIDQWHDSDGSVVYTIERRLSGTYNLAVDYYEHGGGARLRFWWTRIGD